MLLNGTVKLGVLYGGMIEIMESALIELQWSTFEDWVVGNILRACHPEIDNKQKEGLGFDDASPAPSDDDDEEMVLCRCPQFDHLQKSRVLCGLGAIVQEARLPKPWSQRAAFGPNCRTLAFLVSSGRLTRLGNFQVALEEGSLALLDRFSRTSATFARTLTLPLLKKPLGTFAFPRCSMPSSMLWSSTML
ncbi:LOW QUALITY PROTEIN: hypothetical protein Cgig2_026454 [Carnegiea gigantea]|uniref:Uncharacterized protein n=1 Tax=Carnegiea gigantea TaxID=171969 RepID=A0A9Q1KC07_9CARY|nr:LOW QUALITY PROTEIN: hypothetical protein Cgig2_026454 [Carnegiea gigantea]